MNTTLQIPSRQRLVAERLRRHWTQQEVAERLGTTPGNVSRWERGITSPGPYFRNRLCELFGSSAQELGLSWDESDEVFSSYTLPSALVASFQLNLPEQENEDQGQLAQTVAQWLQTGLNRVLNPANAGALVLVVLNSNVYSRPSFLQMRQYDRYTTGRGDCCEEYPALQGTLRQRQGA